MSDLLAIVLPSGLGVRFQDLTPKVGDAVLLAAGQELPPDGTIGMLLALEAKMGYEAMVKFITKGKLQTKPKLQKIKDPETGEETEVKIGEEYDINHPQNVWVKFDPDAEDLPFSNKDHSVLKSLYMDRNKTAPGEVASILGKAVPVVQ